MIVQLLPQRRRRRRQDFNTITITIVGFVFMTLVASIITTTTSNRYSIGFVVSALKSSSSLSLSTTRTKVYLPTTTTLRLLVPAVQSLSTITTRRSSNNHRSSLAFSTARAIESTKSMTGIKSANDDEQKNSGNKRPFSSLQSSSSASASTAAAAVTTSTKQQSSVLYLEEGLFCVEKPLGWTSSDVVGKIRYVLEHDAKRRGAPDPRTKKRKPWMKVGHGGTLDPLATGVLVVGVGSGTKQLQSYLTGPKAYEANIELGYQTTTLDCDPTGSVVERKSYDHVTSYEKINEVLQSKFTGTIQQIPPIFSALKRDGKKLYELGREGQTAEDIKIKSREVTIHQLELVKNDTDNDNDEKKPIKEFTISVECGGGTYIRSLVRDIGIELGTVATMTSLKRTKQGGPCFVPDYCIPYEIVNDSNDTEIEATTPTTTTATNTDDDAKDKSKNDANDDDNNTDTATTKTTPTSSTASSASSTTSHNNNSGQKQVQQSIRIDKRKDCNWTIDTITDAIRSTRKRLVSSQADDP